MTEEKPDQKPEEKKAKEEKPKEAPKEEKLEAEAKPQAEAPAKKEAEKKKKKINRLTLKELEERIEGVQKKMGGLVSSYAQQLLKRKEQLLSRNKTGKDSETGENNAT